MKVFLDSASLADIARYDDDPLVSGITTNPTLLRSAGVTNYAQFAKNALTITEKPISFEVFADEFGVMERQAREIASWGSVYVKIPVTNTRGRSSVEVVHNLLRSGIRVNVTAVFTTAQIYTMGPALAVSTPSIVSIFAGRIADTGRDPIPVVEEASDLFAVSNTEVLWASPRAIYDYYVAERAGADIITMTPALIDKLELCNYDLNTYSLDTVKQFHRDAKAAGYVL